MEGIHREKHVVTIVVCLFASCQELNARLLNSGLPLQVGIRGNGDETLRLA